MCQHYYDYDYDYDDDLSGPAKEEPDCYACNDAGCPSCEPHEDGCRCGDCRRARIARAVQGFTDGLRAIGDALRKLVGRPQANRTRYDDEPPF